MRSTDMLRVILVVAVGVGLVRFAVPARGELLPGWATPKQYENLAPHPRLYVTAAQLERMVAGRGAAFEKRYEDVAAAAETGVVDYENPMAHLSLLDQSIQKQGRLLALVVQWHRTKDRKYLEAALKNLDAMKSWMKPDIINLQEGQFIAGFAITYDLLYNDLTEEERAWMVDMARAYYLTPFLRVTATGPTEDRIEGERGSWWQGKISNWNPVSITGGGLLALTMYEELDEAQTVIDRVKRSYQPIFDYLQATKGGWVEGTGYWNWTIHYMSLFLMSYERTTGETHAGFRSPGFRQTLTFGTYFVPHGEACGFGDNQHGGISPSLFAAAEHLGEVETLRILQAHRAHQDESHRNKAEIRARRRGEDAQPAAAATEPGKKPRAVNISYGPVQDLLMEPDPLPEPLEAEAHVHTYFPEQGWGMVADQWPNSTIYGAMRGGKLGGAHTHHDLLSWHGVVGIEKMVHSIFEAGYYQTAWQSRAYEIFERNVNSKNTLFIGGLGPVYVRNGLAQAEAEGFVLPTGAALRYDATRAFWLTRLSPTMVARVMMTIDDKGLLVIDRIRGRADNPVETRVHTKKKATFGESDVLLEGEFETARLTFAADQPSVLQQAIAMRTSPTRNPETVIRWLTSRQVKDITTATLLTRGADPVDLKLDSRDGFVVISVKSEDWSREIRLTDKLEKPDTGD